MGFTFSSRTSSRRGGKQSLAGKIVATVFGLTFAAFGIGFMAFMGLALGHAVDQYMNWPATEATVIRSELRTDNNDDEDPYHVFVDYTFTWKGVRHTEKPDEPLAKFDTYDEAEALHAQYPEDGQVTCWVDPDRPGVSKLKRDSLWIAPALLFPLIFVCIGLGTVYFTWKPKRAAKTTPIGNGGSARVIPIGGKAKNQTRVGLVLVGFFGLFALVGTIASYFILIRPHILAFDAQDWKPVPCVVESSEVRSHRGDDSTTYSVDILYRYEVDGRTYRSSRYNFQTGSSSGRSAKAKVVRQHPVGKHATCYVDPDDPERAVLSRHVPWFSLELLILLFPLVGYGGLIGLAIYAVRRRTKASSRKRAALSSGREAHRAAIEKFDWLPKCVDAGPMQLKPTTSRAAKFAGMLFMAIFWNGITSIFVTMAVRSHLKGDPEWFLTIFIIPFVIIGLVLIGVAFHKLLGLFNPKVLVTVSNDAIPLGGVLDLTWDIPRAAMRIRRLRIELTAMESATYTRGTDTVTDTEVVYRNRVISTAEPYEIVGGVTSVTIPPDAMHSFKASRNKIEWKLQVTGLIDGWPDVSEDYALVILPRVAEGANHG